jgi:uncharacterized protein
MGLARHCTIVFLALAASLPAGACGFFRDETGPVKDPLMVAIWQGNKAAVGRLLNSWPTLDLRFTTCPGVTTTPLIAAVWSTDSRRGEEHESMVEFLLLHGASPNFSADGFTALHMAASLGNLAMVRMLLRFGAAADPQSKDGTPLLLAVQKGEMAVVQELMAAGANLQVRDSIGNNLVAIAADQHHEALVRLLVQLGVDPCAKDKDGHDAIYWAEMDLNENPHTEPIVRFLKSKCAVYD